MWDPFLYHCKISSFSAFDTEEDAPTNFLGVTVKRHRNWVKISFALDKKQSLQITDKEVPEEAEYKKLYFL